MDQVPGRVAGDTNYMPGDGADPLGQHCEPCKAGGNSVPAGGYCESCEEYLCQACMDHHKRQKISRNHVVLEKSKMPTSANTSNQESDSGAGATGCTEICLKHDKVIAYLCTDHDILGCTMCMSMDHCTCDFDYIPVIARNFKENDEYKSFVQSVDQVAQSMERFDDQVCQGHDAADETYTSAVSELQTFRKQINMYCDKREKDMQAKMLQQKDIARSLIDDVTEDGQKVKEDLQNLKLEMDEQEPAKLFMTVKGSRLRIQTMQEECCTLRDRLRIQTYSYKPSPEIQKLISNDTPLGELVFHEASVPSTSAASSMATTTSQSQEQPQDISVMKLVPSSTIHIHSTSDNDTPLVSGLARYSADILLLTDCYNRSLKMVNIGTQNVIARLPLSGGLRDIAIFPDDRVAVTIPSQRKIVLVSTKGLNLSIVDCIKVRGECLGIAYANKRLIVTYWNPGSVDILNLAGDVLHSVTHDQHGKRFGVCPYYITTQRSESNTYIYVSDADTHTVTKVAMSGDVVCQFTQHGLSPRGIIAVGDGQLAVCSRGDSCIFLLSDDGHQIRPVNQWKCMERPWALILSSKRDMLFVSCGQGTEADNFLHGYKLTPQ